MLKIGYDAKRLFKNVTGLGNYSRTLLKNLSLYYPEHEYYLYTPDIDENENTIFFINDAVFKVKESQHLVKSWWRTYSIMSELEEEGIQLFHGLSHELPANIHNSNIKSIVTIHDLIFKVYPNYFPVIDRQIYNLKFSYSCKNADKVIAISESTKEDIVNYYEVDPDNIEVIYQTCNDIFKQTLSEQIIQKTLAKYDLPNEYLLYVGSIVERKALLPIVKAMKLLSKNMTIPLVVIGNGKKYKKKVHTYIRKHNLEKLILFPEDVSFSDLPAIYQQATIFLYPSKYEGFGLPVIEALYSKTPVITTKLSSLPEAAGPGAFYVDPDEAESIKEGIEALLMNDELREKIIEDGYKHVQRFNTGTLTKEMMDVYLAVLNNGS